MEELKKLILEILSKKELQIKDLYSILQIDKEKKKKYFDICLKKLEEEGKIIERKKGFLKKAPSNYQIVELLPTVGRGKKFYIDNKKYFIPSNKLNGALDFDSVGVLTNNDGSVRVIKTIKRNTGHIVCEMIPDSKGELIPKRIDDKLPVKIISKEKKNLVAGDMVLLKIDKDPIDGYFEAIIEDIIGHKDDPDVEIRAIAASKDIPLDFSKEYIETINNIPNELSVDDYKNREDLRNECIFTIDCDSTKDIDDAVGIKNLANGNYELTVSIADVTHYINPDSIFFKEATKRNNSYYLNDYVIPMFHHKISNGICSLNPNVDRLATTIKMIINDKGDVVDYSICKSVINSKKKMKYSDVNKILEENQNIEGYEKYTENLKLMAKLSEIIEKKKEENGYLGFCSNEIETVYDTERNPIGFDKRDSRTAERIIENFMIIANNTWATHCFWMNIPCIYRNHTEPDKDKLNETIEYLYELGYGNLFKTQFKGSKRELQILIEKIKKLENKEILSNLILRSMRRAKFNSINDGHYALGLNIYGQFTSPIRRLGDLLNHYFLNHYYFNLPVKDIENIEENIEKYTSNMNHSEIIAESVEKMALSLEMSKYMEQHLNKEFEAKIISINHKGIEIITKDNILGYIDLDEFYQNNKFDSNYFGRIGDKILVKAYWIDKLKHKVYFTFEKNLTLDEKHKYQKKKTKVKKK